jgi:hypothetical protein
MAGLIWFVQIVHYPLMREVPPAGFVAYEIAHARLTTRVVAPVMLVELLSSVLLALSVGNLQGEQTLLARVGVGLLAIVWASTFFVQVPTHAKLARGFQIDVWRLLVRTNWVRTIAWSARAVLALTILA